MSGNDFQHPDITWSRHISFRITPDPSNPNALLVEINGGKRTFRVYAKREDFSRIFGVTTLHWVCTHPPTHIGKTQFGLTICNYAPGHEETPPLPGQHCHNCGNLRAEWIEPAPSTPV